MTPIQNTNQLNQMGNKTGMMIAKPTAIQQAKMDLPSIEDTMKKISKAVPNLQLILCVLFNSDASRYVLIIPNLLMICKIW